ncbi:hypothetical protein MC885_000266 [Smutsia gigantea]|nr:hypothetical protein MC885_000266 [Smutsia gigantea]
MGGSPTNAQPLSLQEPPHHALYAHQPENALEFSAKIPLVPQAPLLPLVSDLSLIEKQWTPACLPAHLDPNPDSCSISAHPPSVWLVSQLPGTPFSQPSPQLAPDPTHGLHYCHPFLAGVARWDHRGNLLHCPCLAQHQAVWLQCLQLLEQSSSRSGTCESEVVVRVGVEEALGVVAGVRQDAVHLLVEVAALVGHVHGQAVAVHGVDDAARGDLGLQQADAVVPDDEVLLHGLEQGEPLAGVGVGVAGDGALGRQQLLPDLAAHHARGHRLLHGQPLVAHGVDDEAGGRLRLQQHQGGARPQDALPHGLVDAHLLLPPRLVRGGRQHARDAARALQVALDRVHLRHLLRGLGALGQVPQGLGAQDPGRAQLGRRHLAPQAPEGHFAQPLLRLLDDLGEGGDEGGQGQGAGRVLGQELLPAGLAQVGGEEDVPHGDPLAPELPGVHLHGGGTQGLLPEAAGGLGVGLTRRGQGVAVTTTERTGLLLAVGGVPRCVLGPVGRLGLLDDGGQPAGQRGQAQRPRAELGQQLLPRGAAHVAGGQHVPHGLRRPPQASHLDLHGGGTQGPPRVRGGRERAPVLGPGRQRGEGRGHPLRGQRARLVPEQQVLPQALGHLPMEEELPGGEALALEGARGRRHAGVTQGAAQLLAQLVHGGFPAGQLQHVEARLGVLHAALQQLPVGEVVVRVGVEEALGVVAGVRQDAVHLLVEVAALVGHVHGQAVAVHGVDDAARGDLGLQQADAVVPDDEVLLHGLEQGEPLAGVGVGVAGDGALGRQQLLPDLAAHHARGHRLLHGQPLVAHGVDDEAGGRLRLQQHQGGARPQDALPHGLVDAHLLLPPRLVRGGRQHARDAARALQVALDRVHLRHLLRGLGALGQVPQGLGAQDPGRAQLGRRHLAPQAPEGHFAQPLLRLLDDLGEGGDEGGQGQGAGRVLGQELLPAGLAQVGGEEDVPHGDPLAPELPGVHLHGGGTQGLLPEAAGGLGVGLTRRGQGVAVTTTERTGLLLAGGGVPRCVLGPVGRLGLLDDGGQPAGQRGQAQRPRAELGQQLLPRGAAHVAGGQHVPHGLRRPPQASHLDLHAPGM